MFRNHFLGFLLAVTSWAQVAPVTVEEAKQLSLMREEEKMARDLYRHFYQKYNLAVFDRIARSEQAHFDAIGQLLTRYAVADPAANLPEGTFANADLQALYQQLAAKGDLSLRDALDVGVIVEKTDIADLEVSLKATGKADLKRVFQNLMAASYNHLEAFEECWQISAQ